MKRRTIALVLLWTVTIAGSVANAQQVESFRASRLSWGQPLVATWQKIPY